MSKTQKIIITILITVLTAISASIYLYIDHKKAEQRRIAIWQSQKDFETVLNTFILDLDTKAKAYKKRRRVIAELVQIDNLRDPAYVAENYTMMIATITQMRHSSQAILNEFETMDRNVSNLIERAHLNDKAIITQVWAETKTEQFDFYNRFFKTEDRILQVYEALMEFYVRNTDHFSVDITTETLTFTAPPLKARHDSLLAMLQREKNRQSEILKSK